MNAIIYSVIWNLQDERARANSKTQHVHDQQMFSLLTNHKSKFQLLRMTGLVVRATEEKNLLPLMLLH